MSSFSIAEKEAKRYLKKTSSGRTVFEAAAREACPETSGRHSPHVEFTSTPGYGIFLARFMQDFIHKVY